MTIELITGFVKDEYLAAGLYYNDRGTNHITR